MPKGTTTAPPVSLETATRLPGLQVPIKVYFALMNVVVLCLLFPTLSYFLYGRATDFRDSQLQLAVENHTASLKARGSQLARSLSTSGTQAIANYNFTFLKNLTLEAVSNDPVLIGCLFINQQQVNVISTGFDRQENQQYLSLEPPGDQPKFAEQPDTASPLPVVFNEQLQTGESGKKSTLLVHSPIYVGNELWGTVQAVFSLEKLEKEISTLKADWAEQMNHYKQFFLTITALFFGLGVFSAFLFTRPLLRSIYGLRSGVDRVSDGDLDHKIGIGRISCAEFSGLARSFNSMTDNLRISRQKLDEYSRSLEDKVEERTRELKGAQDELLSQAHEAGKAEMAVGVLHNIGNAITPAKVGVSVLINRLRKSSLRTNLAKAMEGQPDIINQAADIPAEQKEFLTNLMKLLPGSIREEYDHALEELESIRTKQTYIESIIALQMRYATVQGLMEMVDVKQLIEDSLKMVAEALRQRQVRVETDLQQVDPIHLEESKLLQIMLNLIKNGYEAMDSTPVENRKLLISCLQDNQEAVIRVKDNGCGFEQKNSNKFFTFGYSSKQRGSGFGLHSCANYIIANGGTIDALSDGPGKGAEFVIRLTTVKS